MALTVKNGGMRPPSKTLRFRRSLKNMKIHDKNVNKEFRTLFSKHYNPNDYNEVMIRLTSLCMLSERLEKPTLKLKFQRVLKKYKEDWLLVFRGRSLIGRKLNDGEINDEAKLRADNLYARMRCCTSTEPSSPPSASSSSAADVKISVDDRCSKIDNDCVDLDQWHRDVDELIAFGEDLEKKKRRFEEEKLKHEIEEFIDEYDKENRENYKYLSTKTDILHTKLNELKHSIDEQNLDDSNEFLKERLFIENNLEALKTEISTLEYIKNSLTIKKQKANLVSKLAPLKAKITKLEQKLFLKPVIAKPISENARKQDFYNRLGTTAESRRKEAAAQNLSSREARSMRREGRSDHIKFQKWERKV